MFARSLERHLERRRQLPRRLKGTHQPSELVDMQRWRTSIGILAATALLMTACSGEIPESTQSTDSTSEETTVPTGADSIYANPGNEPRAITETPDTAQTTNRNP